ncbi:MAG: AMP-binding protein [Neptuniibacter sp.]
MIEANDGLDQLQEKIENYSRIDQLLSDQIGQYSSNTAYTNMGSSITYQQLENHARNLAAFLQNSPELNSGDRVAIQLPNVLQYPVAVQAIWKAGMVVVNTNPLYTIDEIIQQYRSSGVKAVIILANDAKMLEEIIPSTGIQLALVTQLADLHPISRRLYINLAAKIIRKIVPRYRLKCAVPFRDALTIGERYQLHSINSSSNAPALIQYTVGTTGNPKGVLITHKNLIANFLQVRDRLASSLQLGEEIAIAPLPLYHIYSFALHCLILPSMGAHIVLITNSQDTSGFVNELDRWPFTIFSGLNSLFVTLSQNSQFRDLDFSALKITVSGGMALMDAVNEEWFKITGCRIMQGYGLTEASPVVALSVPGNFRSDSVGKPLALTKIKIIGDKGEKLATGETGEVCIQGPQVMAGYWEQGEISQLDQEWLETGDIGCLSDDGTLKIVERKNDIIEVSGFSVYPSELENIISSHPDIVECAIVGLPDDSCGRIIKLFVVASNKRLTVKQVREYCRERLTNYKVPRLVEFRSELPKSNVGKVIRRKLLADELVKMQKLRKHV